MVLKRELKSEQCQKHIEEGIRELKKWFIAWKSNTIALLVHDLLTWASNASVIIIHELMKSLFLPAKSLATSINQIHSN